MSDQLNINLQGDDSFNINLQSDSLEVDINSMVETSELEVDLHADDNLNVDLDDGQTFDLSLAEGIPIPMDDYNALRNHPSINGEELIGNKTFEQLGRENIRNARLKNIIDDQYDAIFGGN